MRKKLLQTGADELTYEIRGIVKKAEQLKKLGRKIQWENIGDPVQKGAKLPSWIKDTISELAQQDDTYSYCHSKGVLETRQFLAKKNNAMGGVQITEDDILFFNGLGDAIAKIYQYLVPPARIIGPSPAYSTHSSAEAAHANDHPITYNLDPQNNWLPDMDDLYNKVKFNPNIVGILIINPDNPTGMVYPLEILKRFVEIAKEFDLLWFLASNPRRVFNRDQLLDHVWGETEYIDPSTVTVHVRRLREKIEADSSKPRYIHTVWGVGYKFEP